MPSAFPHSRESSPDVRLPRWPRQASREDAACQHAAGRHDSLANRAAVRPALYRMRRRRSSQGGVPALRSACAWDFFNVFRWGADGVRLECDRLPVLPSPCHGSVFPARTAATFPRTAAALYWFVATGRENDLRAIQGDGYETQVLFEGGWRCHGRTGAGDGNAGRGGGGHGRGGTGGRAAAPGPGTHGAETVRGGLSRAGLDSLRPAAMHGRVAFGARTRRELL